MQTKYDVGDKVLVEAEVKEICVSEKGKTYTLTIADVLTVTATVNGARISMHEMFIVPYREGE